MAGEGLRARPLHNEAAGMAANAVTPDLATEFGGNPGVMEVDRQGMAVQLDRADARAIQGLDGLVAFEPEDAGIDHIGGRRDDVGPVQQQHGGRLDRGRAGVGVGPRQGQGPGAEDQLALADRAGAVADDAGEAVAEAVVDDQLMAVERDVSGGGQAGEAVDVLVAVERQGPGAVDRDPARSLDGVAAAEQGQRAAVDGGRAGIDAGAGQGQRARAQGEAA